MNFLSIGHTCHDRLGERNILGGTASYSSLVAKQLGLTTGILSSVGDDFEFFDFFEKNGIRVWNKKAERTTVFENIYQINAAMTNAAMTNAAMTNDDNAENRHRTQYLHARAETLFAADVPAECFEAKIVLFCPIADEVDFSTFEKFPTALKGATIQGWLRQWDAQGKISPKEMDWSQLAAADVVIMSDADIQGFEAKIPEIASFLKVLVMTQGARGATVFSENQQFHFPAFPVKEVDATGAGDVFATAFLIKYSETRDLSLATGFAHCAASFVVEGVGIENLLRLSRIQERFGIYQKEFLTT